MNSIGRFIVRRPQTPDMFHNTQTVKKKWEPRFSAAISTYDLFWQLEDYSEESPRINRHFQSDYQIAMLFSAELSVLLTCKNRMLLYPTGRFIIRRLQTSGVSHSIQAAKKEWASWFYAAVSVFDLFWQPVNYSGKSPRINRHFQNETKSLWRESPRMFQY